MDLEIGLLVELARTCGACVHLGGAIGGGARDHIERCLPFRIICIWCAAVIAVYYGWVEETKRNEICRQGRAGRAVTRGKAGSARPTEELAEAVCVCVPRALLQRTLFREERYQ